MASPAQPPRSLTEVTHRKHLPALDGLRAVAVGLVVLSHADYPIHGVPGDLGVSAFFVLSGFLITRLLLAERDATGDVSFRRFYLRRTLRIFPAYYAFLTVSLLVDTVMHTHWDRALLASALTYTVNYYNAFHNHPTTTVAHAWSLAVEEQFYFLWPLAFLLLVRRGRRTLARGLAIATVAVLLWRSWMYLHANAGTAYVYNAFDTRFDNLAVGCLLAVLVDAPAADGVARALSRRAWFALVPIAALVVSRHYAPATYHYSIGFTIDALLVAVLITQLFMLHTSRLWSWLEHPVTRYLGVISYPIYLYHAWGGSIARRLPVHAPAAQFALNLAATIGLASGSYWLIERRFLALRHRVEAKERPVALPQAELG